jgi:hypothetical protein
LDAVERVLPIGPLEWTQIKTQQAISYWKKKRDISSLHQKFGQLLALMPPRGEQSLADD